jgi:hypothetical protein
MFGLFEGAEALNYIYQLEIPIIVAIVVLVLYIFYSLNLFKKQ